MLRASDTGRGLEGVGIGLNGHSNDLSSFQQYIAVPLPLCIYTTQQHTFKIFSNFFFGAPVSVCHFSILMLVSSWSVISSNNRWIYVMLSVTTFSVISIILKWVTPLQNP